ncbi:SusC/RagA family TonB-linked outer membrane protein [Pseudobacter ginsenosidimutans]|uniref:TonB-linked SusC/RagA family outer membrane protein n=1 Tax=Pseudobacter ginsenosidimutans TaxID=661488 RepID=A0A4Q7N371_9BACT|nr:SusC/RagA family TonB-linked outer membrane protein [Pseudobacter ginsenosidimutans]RZS74905.1 TonB-linked SusC/RagA family outer membrane protein [Pseudobacter ginsenosidimutans]
MNRILLRKSLRTVDPPGIQVFTKLTKWGIVSFLLLLVQFAHAQTISLQAKNITLQKVFNEIRKQTGYDVFYNSRQIDSSIKVTVNAKAQPLDAFMQQVLQGHPFSHSIIGSTILVRREDKPKPASLLTDPTQTGVQGVVLDEKTRTPLLGVTVMLGRTRKGTQTDAMGKFHIREVQDDDSIVFSMVGYTSIVRRFQPEVRNMMVLLRPAVSDLDAAVVQAYGVTSKRLSTGNISRVSGEELRRQPAINPLAALQGKVPGMTAVITNGHPSAPVKLEIRGRSSLNSEFSGEPLYIVDGVIRTILDGAGSTQYDVGTSPGFVQAGGSFTGGQSIFFGMNAEDIESIEVLKDGDATAIYGSRGANGVVIITTRKAQPGKTTFTVQLNQEFTDIARYPKMIDRETYFNLRREALRNDGIGPTEQNAPDLVLWDTTRYIDWNREIYQTGANTRVMAAASGGDNRNSFRLSSSYNTLRTINKGPDKNGVLNINFSYNHKSSDGKLDMGLTTGYIYTFTEAARMPVAELAPNAPAILDSNGKPNYAPFHGLGSIARYEFASLFQPGITKVNSFTSSFNAGYAIAKGLSLRVTAGYSSMSSINDILIPLASLSPLETGLTGSVLMGRSTSSNWNADPTINYGTNLGRGQLDVMVGTSIQQRKTIYMSLYGAGYTNDNLLGSIADAAVKDIVEGTNLYRYNAVFGRINFRWDRKYILNLNGRRDGSSRFGPGKQFGNFGSIGFAWVLSEEEWWKKNIPSFLNFFKLRGSYGLSGNDNVSEYQYLSQWGTQLGSSSSSKLYDYNGERPYAPMHAVNQLFQWETVTKQELGTELELFNKLMLSVSWYRQVCDNQLTSQPVGSYTGFSFVVTNSPAKVENRGVEIQLGGDIIKRKNFTWRGDFNIAFNRNRLLAYPNLDKSRHASRYRIGESLNVNFLYHYMGVDPLTGEYRFEDYNKDGSLSNGNGRPGGLGNDRYVVFDKTPKFNGGFSSSVAWKNLSFSLGFAFAKMLMVDPLLSVNPGAFGEVYIPDQLLRNYWKKPGDIAAYGKASTQSIGIISNSDAGIIDGSSLQLNNISVAWGLPQKLLKQAGFQSASVSVNANNIYTFSRYKGLGGYGLATVSQPVQRTFALVLQFNF